MATTKRSGSWYKGWCRLLLVRLPMAYIMSIQPNASLTMIGLSAPTSTAVGILLNISFFLCSNGTKI